MTDISNTDDVIDSRDVIARITELTELRDDAEDQASEYGHSYGAGPFGKDEREELASLQELAEEAEDYSPDWLHGETLIHETHFTDYTEQLVTDCGYISADLPGWIKIDWEATAEETKVDYTEVDFDGQTYLIRNG